MARIFVLQNLLKVVNLIYDEREVSKKLEIVCG